MTLPRGAEMRERAEWWCRVRKIDDLAIAAPTEAIPNATKTLCELMAAFAESESSLARKKEREACAKLACHFCAYPGEWSTAEKMDNGWMHLYGERRASVVACAAAAIHERNREEQP